MDDFHKSLPLPDFFFFFPPPLEQSLAFLLFRSPPRPIGYNVHSPLLLLLRVRYHKQSERRRNL